MPSSAFSSIRSRLLALVLLATLPAVGLILYNAHRSGEQAVETARGNARQLAQHVASDYEHVIIGTKQMLRALSLLPEIRAHNSRFCNRLMADVLAGHPYYINLGAIRPDGQVFCSAEPMQGVINASDRLYFRNAVATRNFSIGEYQIGRITGKPVVVTSYPSYDDGDKLRAVVFVSLDLTRIDHAASLAQLPPNSSVNVLDNHGTILNRYPDPEKWIGKSRADTPLFEAIESNSGGLIKTTGYDSVERLYAYTTLRESPHGSPLYVAVGIPYDNVVSGTHAMLLRSGASLAIVTLLILLAAWFGGNYFLLRKIDALVDASRRLARGERARTGIADARGEIGLLARTFDDMANAIEARRDEIQRANDALRDSEERFRTLVEATSDWIWEVDARGVYTYASPKIRDLLGYAPEEVVGKTPFDFMPPDEAARIREQFAEIVAARRPFEHLENTNLHKDGGRVVIETSGVPIFDREGRLAGYRGIDRDITKRRQVEAALLESEAKLRTVSESARDAILMIDDRGKITFWNHAAETMFGYRREETLGKDMAELIVPARLREMHNQGLGAFQRTGQGAAVGKLLELPAQRRDGSEFIAEHSISAVKLEGKWHAVGIVRDITERRKAEATYHQAHELLEKIFTTTHILIAYLDTDFNFVRVNRAYAEADGRSPEFFADKNHFALYPGAETEAIFRRVVQTGEPYTVYARPFTYPDHPERGVTYWDWSLQPVRDPGGKISGLVFSLVNATDRVHAQEQIQYLAYYDELTGLPNRTLLLDRLKQNIVDAGRHKRQVAVLCLNLNDFKNVNDTLGYDVGNQAIKTLGGRLSECVRPGDTVARLGGDEFCVALADLAHPDDVAEIIQKILGQFTHTFHVRDHDLYLAAALGASLYPNDGRDPETLLKNADIAMYRAKERGDSYQYYSADMTLTASEHLALENDLRHVLERNELLLHYQPQVNLASGKITGVEALVRWQHPERGMISPAKFIPLAENTNLIIPIGAWVLRTACAQGKAWQEQGLPPLRVAVNFSARQFRLPNLENVIRQILDETALDPRLLDIELTESTLIQNPEAIATVLGQLEKLGAHISVDDFGTGYSSLSYLKRFPIDILKIDQSFVHDIATDPNDAAIVIAIITLAHALGIQTIAEGVETREQAQFLRKHGCEAMQGFYFSKPIEADALAALLRKQARQSERERVMEWFER